MSNIHIVISKKTSDRLKECLAEYRRNHPEFDEMKISQNKLVYEICRYYLE